jgi:hypothetical protein
MRARAASPELAAATAIGDLRIGRAGLTRAWPAWAVILAVAVLCAAWLGVGGRPGVAGSVRHTELARSPAQHRLESLPLAARGPVAALLGRADRTYWVHELSAHNPAQGLRAGFSPNGVSVHSGSGVVRFSLAQFGRPGALARLPAVTPVVRANRVVYARGGLRVVRERSAGPRAGL